MRPGCELAAVYMFSGTNHVPRRRDAPAYGQVTCLSRYTTIALGHLAAESASVTNA